MRVGERDILVVVRQCLLLLTGSHHSNTVTQCGNCYCTVPGEGGGGGGGGRFVGWGAGGGGGGAGGRGRGHKGCGPAAHYVHGALINRKLA